MKKPPEPSDPPRPPRKPVRQNPHQTVTRWNNDDYAKLQANAERAGMNLSSYIRFCTLEKPATPSRRRLTVELRALATTQAAVNKMGGNLHVIARHYHFHGIIYPEELVTALAGFGHMVAALDAAVGRAR